jgi:hypothetical protein
MKLSMITEKKGAQTAFTHLRNALTRKAESFVQEVKWPNGRGRFQVFWHSEHGIWALPRKQPPHGQSNRFWCAYGTQNPALHKSLRIMCEINPPTIDNARSAGAFVRDSGGELYLVHTGRIGGGAKGVGKVRFLDFYKGPRQTVEWPDGRSTEFAIIGRISSPSFLSDLAKFVFAVERFKTKVAATNIDEQLEKDAKNAEHEGFFEPDNIKDIHKKVLRQITMRRGQPAFRNKLVAAYGGRCAVTDCDSSYALEAAHIRPYGGEGSNHVQNGLLLRSDIHTLFDLGNIGIDPKTFKIIVAAALKCSVYERLSGKDLNLPSDTAKRPNEEVLQEHLDRWELKAET